MGRALRMLLTAAAFLAVGGTVALEANGGNGGDGAVASTGGTITLQSSTVSGARHGPPSNPLIVGPNPTGVSGNTAGDIDCQHS
jgi:hypothetical protein